VITVEKEACIGCGVCVRVCDRSVLSLDCAAEHNIMICHSTVSDAGECDDCGRCIEECLVGAISGAGRPEGARLRA
jgi:ferredoxin